MINIIKSEIFRLRKSKRNLVVLLFLLIITPAVYFSQNNVENTAKNYLTPEYRIEDAKKYIRYYKNQIQEIKSNPEKTAAEKKTAIRVLEFEIENKNEEIKFAEETEKKGSYAEDEKKRINDFEINTLQKNGETNPQLKDYYTFKESYARIISRSGYYMDTAAYSTPFTYILNFISVYSMYILGIGMIILGLNLISGEYQGDKILRFAKSPASKEGMYLGKLMSLFLWSLVLFIGLGTLGTIVTGVIKGTSFSDFPMLFVKSLKSQVYNGINYPYAPEGSFTTLPMAQFSAYAFLYEILFIFVLASFVILISCIFRNIVLSGFVIIGIMVVSNALPNIAPGISEKLAQLSFLSFNNPYLIFTGKQAEFYHNSSITPFNGIIVLILSGALFTALGLIWFKKQGLDLTSEEQSRKDSKTQYISTTMSKLDVKTSSPWDKAK